MRTNEEPVFANSSGSLPPSPPFGAIEAWQLPAGPDDGAVREHALRIRHVELLQRHRDLDDSIARLSEANACDELLLARLKKRKLQIKDEIARSVSVHAQLVRVPVGV